MPTRPLYLYRLAVRCLGTVYHLSLVDAHQAEAASRASDRYPQADHITTQRLCRIA